MKKFSKWKSNKHTKNLKQYNKYSTLWLRAHLKSYTGHKLASCLIHKTNWYRSASKYVAIDYLTKFTHSSINIYIYIKDMLSTLNYYLFQIRSMLSLSLSLVILTGQDTSLKRWRASDLDLCSLHTCTITDG